MEQEIAGYEQFVEIEETLYEEEKQTYLGDGTLRSGIIKSVERKELDIHGTEILVFSVEVDGVMHKIAHRVKSDRPLVPSVWQMYSNVESLSDLAELRVPIRGTGTETVRAEEFDKSQFVECHQVMSKRWLQFAFQRGLINLKDKETPVEKAITGMEKKMKRTYNITATSLVLVAISPLFIPVFFTEPSLSLIAYPILWPVLLFIMIFAVYTLNPHYVKRLARKERLPEVDENW